MKKHNILLIYGGGGSEHKISVTSSKYVQSNLENNPQFDLTCVEIVKGSEWRAQDGKQCFLGHDKILRFEESNKSTLIDYVIPCIHGVPGETGDLQSYLEMLEIPYLGCRSEASKLCFNKISTKLWFTALGIPNTKFTFLTNPQDSRDHVEAFFNEHSQVFVKAASQGSSVGCYKATTLKELHEAIDNAFKYSPHVLIEKKIRCRELEVSTYEYQGKIHATFPGEIVTPGSAFYTFEEKYSSDSHTQTHIRAQGITPELEKQIRELAIKAFKGLQLRHLSRIDFFLDLETNELLLNEINTFPGMTPISMFPKMLEANGHEFKSFLTECVSKDLAM